MQIKKILFLLCFLFQPMIYAQIGEQENPLKEKAEDFFLDQNYTEAAPLYSQLLSNDPKDPLYNFRYGVCVLFTEKNKSQAAEFLEAANGKNRVGPEVYFFLGRAYQMNYRFDEAIAMFEKFQKEGSKRMKEKWNVPRFISQTISAKKLFAVSGKLELQDTLKVALSSLYSAYDFSALEGRILATPDKYRSSIDVKKNANKYLYYSKKSELILYSSYGSSGRSGLDIYMVFKMPDGEWAKPVLLDSKINTNDDEAYPFITPDGNNLYFCSKAHDGIGGYDVFRSGRMGKTEWSDPINMGIPVNSPMDDIFFVSDDSNESAFFASDRENVPGLFNIFKVKMKKQKAEFALIRGKFFSNKSSSKSVKISVLSVESKEIVGIYNTNKTTGDYIINLKPGKTYEFIVQEKGGIPFSKQIYIPEQRETDNFRQ